MTESNIRPDGNSRRPPTGGRKVHPRGGTCDLHRLNIYGRRSRWWIMKQDKVSEEQLWWHYLTDGAGPSHGSCPGFCSSHKDSIHPGNRTNSALESKGSQWPSLSLRDHISLQNTDLDGWFCSILTRLPQPSPSLHDFSPSITSPNRNSSSLSSSSPFDPTFAQGLEARCSFHRSVTRNGFTNVYLHLMSHQHSYWVQINKQ